MTTCIVILCEFSRHSVQQLLNISVNFEETMVRLNNIDTLSQTLIIYAKLLPHVFNHQKLCLKGGLMPGEHFERRRVWGSVQREPDRFFGMMVSCVRRLRPPVEGTCRLWGDPGPGEVEEGFRWSILILLGLLSGDAFYRVQESIWSWNIIDLSFLFWFRLLILSVIGVVFLLQKYM